MFDSFIPAEPGPEGGLLSSLLLHTDDYPSPLPKRPQLAAYALGPHYSPALPSVDISNLIVLATLLEDASACIVTLQDPCLSPSLVLLR